MDATSLLEYTAVVARYVHVVAAIMWIGNSLLFTWMEINFIKEGKENDESVLGYMNMLHAGGVYYLEKRVIDPQTLPSKMHRFLWQSYTTWISGFILFISVFYVHGSSLLADPGKVSMTDWQATLISVGSLLGAWIVYDIFWKTPIKNRPLLGATICLVLILGYAAWLETIFNGRAVYLQVGAMMGTIMTANVFYVIIPNQKKMMRALMEGKPHNLELGKQAKVRSLMNHYITFPVIFLMLSAHFPQTYAADRNILILAVVMVSLIIIKHMMNIYNEFKDWLYVLVGTFLTGSALVFMLIAVPPLRRPDAVSSTSSAPAVAINEEAKAGEAVFNAKGCQACHLPTPSAIAPSLHGLFGHTVELADGTEVTADEDYVRLAILDPAAQVVKGFAPAMPAYTANVNKEELEQLVEYIKSIGD